jgi:hypothetical protein
VGNNLLQLSDILHFKELRKWENILNFPRQFSYDLIFKCFPKMKIFCTKMCCILRNKTNARQTALYTSGRRHIKTDLLEKMIHCNRTHADVIKFKAHNYHASWFGFQLNSLVLIDFLSSYEQFHSLPLNGYPQVVHTSSKSQFTNSEIAH